MAEIQSFIWDEKHECMGEDERRELVGKRLVDCVKRTYENVPYYKKKLDKAGVTPDDIKSLDDIEKHDPSQYELPVFFPTVGMTDAEVEEQLSVFRKEAAESPRKH